VAASRGLDIDLLLQSGNRKQIIADSARRGRRDAVGGLICGQDSLILRMYRARGKGTYKVAAVYPIN